MALCVFLEDPDVRMDNISYDPRGNRGYLIDSVFYLGNTFLAVRHWRTVEGGGRVIFVETTMFRKLLKELMNDDEYREFQQFLANNPKAGKVIKGSGGLRKVRRALDAQGKSGGAQVIYY